MILIYGLAKNETERYMETLLATTATTKEQIEAVKAAAAKDGFHSFRVTNFDENAKPDFTKTLNA